VGNSGAITAAQEKRMRHVIVTTSPVFGTMGDLPARIAASSWELIRCADTSKPDGGLSAYQDIMEILVVGLVPATADTINNSPKLRAIFKHGVGVDNIDIPAATARKIPVINAPGSNANAVAELALGGMLCLARRIPMAHQEIVNGGWQRTVGTEIGGKTLGVVGFGNIGKVLASKARALGMRVLATDLCPDKLFAAEHQVELTDLPDVLRRSDYVALHIFGGKGNINLIGAKELALMKPEACLINCARGEVLDLDALAAALEKGALRGAAIDAYVKEPPDRSHPIFSSPKVVFTPHCGADTRESGENMGRMTLDGIDAFLAGKRPNHILNPEVFG